MTKLPLVSVFMPTYNHEEFIADAIESVLAQDYPNLEIVVCDDCSTDKTARIVRQYAEKYPNKIKPVFNQVNHGITTTCNVTLRNCTGKYVAFTSGDDLFLGGKIHKQIMAMERDESIVMAYHDVEAFYSDTGETIRFWNHGPSSVPPVQGDAAQVARAVTRGNDFLSGQSVMARRECIPDSGYEDGISIASDWLMWIELLARAGSGAKVLFMPEVLARYRRHRRNISYEIKQQIDEKLMTLDIVESRYQWLANSANIGKSKIYYSHGVQNVRNRNPEAGRKYLWRSLKGGKLTRHWLRWYAASFFPILLKSKRQILGLK